MQKTLIKVLLSFIFFLLIISIILLKLINENKIIYGLSKNEQDEIFDIIGLESYQSVSIKSFQARRYADEGFNLLEIEGVIDIEEFVKVNTVIESYYKIDSDINFSFNSKYFPRNCRYCILLYDENGNTFLSIRNHSYDGGSKLMDYFYEIY